MRLAMGFDQISAWLYTISPGLILHRGTAMSDTWGRARVFWVAAGFEGGLIGVAWLLGWLLGHDPFAALAWDARDAGLGLASVAPLLLLYLAGTRWPVGPLRRIKQLLEEFVGEFFRRCTWLDLALISLLAGLGEEALFRGVVQGALGDWLDAWAALVLASLLFGLAHSLTPTYAVLTTLVGVYLGGLWLLTGNLLGPIITHAVYDFLVLLLLRRQLARDERREAKRGVASEGTSSPAI